MVLRFSNDFDDHFVFKKTLPLICIASINPLDDVQILKLI